MAFGGGVGKVCWPDGYSAQRFRTAGGCGRKTQFCVRELLTTTVEWPWSLSTTLMMGINSEVDDSNAVRLAPSFRSASAQLWRGRYQVTSFPIPECINGARADTRR